MVDNVSALNSTPMVGAFQFNPYAYGLDDLDLDFNNYPMGMNGSIFTGYNGFNGMGAMPMVPGMYGMGGNNQSYFDNMKEYQKFYIDYNVDQHNMQRNADLRINASMEGIQTAAATLQDKIRQNEQDQIQEAFKAYLDKVAAAYGQGSDAEVKARALSLYQQLTGKPLTQDIRDNAHGSFTQGLLQSLTFSMGYRHSAEDNIAEIRGQSVGTEEKFTQNVGRATGAVAIGGLAYGAVKGLQKYNAAGVLKNVKPGKVGLIAAGIGLVTAALSYITGKSST